MARKLRIAASVFCGMLSVALVVLWVQGYAFPRHVELVTKGNQKGYAVSNRGVLGFGYSNNANAVYLRQGWSTWSPERASRKSPLFDFYYLREPDKFHFYLPIWIPTLLSVPLIVLPNMRFWSARFSLRTLLVATTLVAVVLGLGAWLAS